MKVIITPLDVFLRWTLVALAIFMVLNLARAFRRGLYFQKPHACRH